MNLDALIAVGEDTTLSCEALVVGSGAGGSVVAAHLAAAGVDTLLLEEGDYRPLDTPRSYTTEEMRAKYRQGGLTPALGKPPVAYVEARCVGGGTEVNSGLYHRTPADALRRWRDGWAVRDFDPEDLQPHFDACERDLTVGPLPDGSAAPPSSRKLAEGARRLGWDAPEVPRVYRYEGGTARRASMTETLLPRALAAGLRLLPGARVERLRRKGDRVTKVVARAGAFRVEVTPRVVFVCAGAIQTPALLRRSGVTRNVGNTLQLHPTVKVVARFEEAIDAHAGGVPMHQVREFAPAISLGGSVSTPGHVALVLADNDPSQLARLEEWRRSAVYYAAVRGTSRGTVRNLPGGGGVLVRYPVSDDELRLLGQGVAYLGEALFAAGARELVPGLTGHASLRDPADCDRYRERPLPRAAASLMTVHLFSSAPMGEAAHCACDSYGRVHGLANLYVADASLLPDAPGCNPQGTIMALARRVALRYLDAR